MSEKKFWKKIDKEIIIGTVIKVGKDASEGMKKLDKGIKNSKTQGHISNFMKANEEFLGGMDGFLDSFTKPQKKGRKKRGLFENEF